MTWMCETQNATIAIMAKQISDQSELLQKRKKAKKAKKGKRVRLEGVSIYTTAEVLRIAREAKAEPTTKRPRGRPRKAVIVESSSEEEAEDLGFSSDSSDEEPVKRTRYATRSCGEG